MRRVLDVASWVGIFLLCGLAIVATAGLALGYRPVAITTGSMSPWAATGSLVVAGPVAEEDIEVGDVLVMRIDEQTLVTHRVIELQRIRGQLEAITQGDANEDPDTFPYEIAASEMRADYAIPQVGKLLVALNYRVVLLLVVTGAIALLAQTGLRFIWADDVDDEDDEDDDGDDERDAPNHDDIAEAQDGRVEAATLALKERVLASPKRRATALPIATALLTLLMADASYALYTATESVSGNSFNTLDCLIPGGVAVHHGTLSNSKKKTETVTIPTVDPTQSFLTFSVNGSGNEPETVMVLGELTDATTVTFSRSTPGKIERVDIDWTVVQNCGVEVQRGSVAGNSSTTLDVAIATVDPTRSFAMMSVLPDKTDTTYNQNEMARPEIVGTNTLRLHSYNLDPQVTYGWQVVSWIETGTASVQNVSTTMAVGTTTSNITLPTAVDTTKTFLVASAISNAAGPDIGQQLIRVRPTSGTNIEVTRGLGSSESVEVHVQVVSLFNGTSVQHGTANMAQLVSIAAAAISPVDTTISSAMSTVNMPSGMGGGSTLVSGDDPLGDASAIVAITGPSAISLTRGDTNQAASFSWQVIQWAL